MAGDAARILTALPQTQCTRCGYPDCAAYADAISAGAAAINQCPPGGAQGIARLAAITGQVALALNPDNGCETARTVAIIDEAWCIGCTLCIKACPVDAIMGSNKLMHTVIEAYCTGCELCLPVCPVDCIALQSVTGAATGWAAWSPTQANLARDRYRVGKVRRARDLDENGAEPKKTASIERPDLLAQATIADSATSDKKRALIESALARSRARHTPRTGLE